MNLVLFFPITSFILICHIYKYKLSRHLLDCFILFSLAGRKLRNTDQRIKALARLEQIFYEELMALR